MGGIFSQSQISVVDFDDNATDFNSKFPENEIINNYVIPYNNSSGTFQDDEFIRNYKVNFGKVKKVFGFEPKFSIEDGIDELIQLINKNVFDIVEKNLDFFGNYKVDYKDLI